MYRMKDSVTLNMYAHLSGFYQNGVCSYCPGVRYIMQNIVLVIPQVKITSDNGFTYLHLTIPLIKFQVQVIFQLSEIM